MRAIYQAMPYAVSRVPRWRSNSRPVRAADTDEFVQQLLHRWRYPAR